MGEDWGLREVGCPGGGRLTGMSEQNLLPAYLIVGTDGLKRQKALEKLRARVSQVCDLDFNSDSFVGGEASGDEIVGACLTLPFASDVRLVVVTDVDQMLKADSEALVSYLKEPCPTTVLCMVAEGLKKTTRLYKAAAAVGKTAVIGCDPLKKYELPAQVRQMATAYGFVLSADGAARLVELVGENTVHIDAELKKLSVSHVGNQPVGPREVEALVARTSQAKTWDFTDAFANRDLQGCLKVLGTMESASPYALMAACENRLRELLICHGLARRGIKDVKSWATYFKAPEWRYKNHYGWAKKWGTSELRRSLSSARDCERAMKSTSDAMGVFLDWLVDTVVKKPTRS